MQIPQEMWVILKSSYLFIPLSHLLTRERMSNTSFHFPCRISFSMFIALKTVLQGFHFMQEASLSPLEQSLVSCYLWTFKIQLQAGWDWLVTLGNAWCYSPSLQIWGFSEKYPSTPLARPCTRKFFNIFPWVLDILWEERFNWISVLPYY